MTEPPRRQDAKKNKSKNLAAKDAKTAKKIKINN
jgi:hypothetical protein